METKKIIKIGKEIIYIAGFYKNYKNSEKEKIKEKLNFYKKELNGSENIYSKKLIEFIEDLLGDLEKNQELQIDQLFEDDFIGNYYESANQVKIYNSLIEKNLYKKIFDSENKSKNNLYFSEFYENFIKNYKLLETKKISHLLLIFTLFDIVSPTKFLTRLFDFRKDLGLNTENIKKLISLINKYKIFLKLLQKLSLQNLKQKNIAYKYIKIEKIGEEKDFELKFILQDASKDDFRSGNYLYEYREIIKNLQK